jgi:hypothetical protein
MRSIHILFPYCIIGRFRGELRSYGSPPGLEMLPIRSRTSCDLGCRSAGKNFSAMGREVEW